MKTARETFAGRRRQPELFGLERHALYPIAGAWTAAAMLLTLLQMRSHFGWGGNLVLTVAPAIAITAAVLLLVQGKPPGHWRDWLEEQLGGRDYDYPPQDPSGHVAHKRA